TAPHTHSSLPFAPPFRPVPPPLPYTTLFRSVPRSRSDLSAAVRRSRPALIDRAFPLVAAAPPANTGAALGDPAFVEESDVQRVRSEEHTLNSSHLGISYAVFCLKKKKNMQTY